MPYPSWLLSAAHAGMLATLWLFGWGLVIRVVAAVVG